MPKSKSAGNGKSQSEDSHDARPHSGAFRVSPAWPYIVAAVLSLIGLADSIYLTVKHLTGQSVQCTVSTGCDEVLSSSYAILFGYPLAAFGALAYFAAFSLVTLTIFGYRHTRTLFVVLVGLMTLMTLRLLYVQAFVLRRYCEFCLLSAAITLSLAVIAFAFGFIESRKIRVG